MSPSPASPAGTTPPRTAARWFASALLVLAVIAGVYAWRKPANPTNPGAYLLPVDQDSRARLSGWRTTQLTTTHAVPAGGTVAIPKGSRIRVLHATGQLEEIVGPRELTFPSTANTEELDHFRSPLPRLVAELQPNEVRRAPPVRITSPADLTRYLNPVVTWDALPEVFFDVAIVDPADPRMPPRIAEKVRPPVKFDDLQSQQRKELPRDRIHQVLVFDHGSGIPAGSMQFLTGADAIAAEPPTDLADLLAEATTALAKRPFRTGDAWIALQRLPAGWDKSELALRLKMKAAAELGLEHELHVAKQAATKK